MIAAFQEIIRRKAGDRLDGWLDRGLHTLVAAFAKSLMKDKAAVAAAIASPWSNGQTKGQICKLKLVKRQMYGRGENDLLQLASSASHDGFIEIASKPNVDGKIRPARVSSQWNQHHLLMANFIASQIVETIMNDMQQMQVAPNITGVKRG